MSYFTTKSRGFTMEQDFKNENLGFLNLYSVHTAVILDLSLDIMLSLSK